MSSIEANNDPTFLRITIPDPSSPSSPSGRSEISELALGESVLLLESRRAFEDEPDSLQGPTFCHRNQTVDFPALNSADQPFLRITQPTEVSRENGVWVATSLKSKETVRARGTEQYPASLTRLSVTDNLSGRGSVLWAKEAVVLDDLQELANFKDLEPYTQLIKAEEQGEGGWYLRRIEELESGKSGVPSMAIWEYERLKRWEAPPPEISVTDGETTANVRVKHLGKNAEGQWTLPSKLNLATYDASRGG